MNTRDTTGIDDWLNYADSLPANPPTEAVEFKNDRGCDEEGDKDADL